ncbi:hypothetical protein N7508_009415 [Penicillium antarcticum]|uniref:uncharacterized protein n=1 Tax=Penicillium antarcticum TaxID=416450 RepID=UPI002396098C|nr:uncharacterized protein N7508_009415 [Penicillium antarcticum]KAJ5294594.1 hypothetical protein N7508_009415 [Penicillium antarcticum]
MTTNTNTLISFPIQLFHPSPNSIVLTRCRTTATNKPRTPSVFKLETITPESGLFNPAPTGQHFFYGTLHNSTLLTSILDLTEDPVLRPAYLDGYKTKLWGSYPTLLPKEPRVTGQGSVYGVMSVEHVERLATYETNSYATMACELRFEENGDSVYDEGVLFFFFFFLCLW